jgi:hypothetical protein
MTSHDFYWGLLKSEDNPFPSREGLGVCKNGSQL